MATRRMVPTRFFKDPDIMNVSSKDAQLILIGLILAADDEGREVAHAGLLGREMDYAAEQIEAALQELAANDLLLLYQVGKHRYYQLTRWSQWQTLGGRITPSRYPAPPSSVCPEEEHATDSTCEDAGETSGKRRGISQDFPDQCNRTESNRTEDEGEENHPGTLQTAGKQAHNVVPFPTSHVGNSDGKREREGDVRTQQIAHILTLPVTDALHDLMEEYTPLLARSLTGEAYAAREWIDDPQRNRKRRRMSLAFFRNWLKREVRTLEQQNASQALQPPSTGTYGEASSPPGPSVTPSVRRPPDLMHLAQQDAQAKGAKRR